MKIYKTNAASFLSRWTHFVGVSLRTGLTAVLPLFLLIAGCSKDETAIVGPTPIVIPLQTTVQATVNLRSTAGFVILAGSLVSKIPTSAITGDIGLSPATRSFITGFGLTEVTGTIYAADDISPAGVPAMLTAAKGDLTTAYNDAAGRTSTDMVLLAGNIGGLTLVPGMYKFTSGALITGSDVTLTGSANDVWIFQIAQGLTVGNGAIVTLSGGAPGQEHLLAGRRSNDTWNNV